MGAEEADDLLARDTHTHSPADGFTSNFAGDHIWVASGEASEELQDGDLQLGGSVGVDAVICLDDDEALIAVCRTQGVVEACGSTAEGARVRGKGCGKASGVEARRLGARLIDYAKVPKIFEHLKLGRGESSFAVILTEFEATEHKQEREYVDWIHS